VNIREKEKQKMTGLIIRWLILTSAIIAASYLIDGIRISGFFSAFFTAAVLGILNVFFRPVLLILTLPINILTLGLFTFVINALLLKMASGIIPGFDVYGFWSAIFGSLVISGVNWILSSFIKGHGRLDRMETAKREEGNYIDLVKKDDDKWE
jgi:putative membrane protein